MKTFYTFLLFSGLSFNALAHTESDIKVEMTNAFIDSDSIFIHNLSVTEIKFDAHGKNFTLSPDSGINLACEGSEVMTLLISHPIHDYINIACQSLLSFDSNPNYAE